MKGGARAFGPVAFALLAPLSLAFSRGGARGVTIVI